MRWFRRSHTPAVVINNYVSGSGEVDELLAAITQLNGRLDMIDFTALTTEVGEIHDIAQSASTALGAIRSENATISSKLSDALAKVDALTGVEAERDELRAIIAEAQAQVDGLTTSLDETGDSLASAIANSPAESTDEPTEDGDEVDGDPAPTEGGDEATDAPTPGTGEGEQPVEDTPAQTDPQPEVDVPTNANEGTSPDIVIDEGDGDGGAPTQGTSTGQVAEGDSGVTDGGTTPDNGGTGEPVPAGTSDADPAAGEVTPDNTADGQANIAPGTEAADTVVE